MTWRAPEAYTPWDGPDDEDDLRREQLEEDCLARYEDDPDGQEDAWHESHG